MSENPSASQSEWGPTPASNVPPHRRDVLIGGLMAGGLVAGYGAFGAMAARFLFPARPALRGWVYVSDVRSFPVGASMVFRTPEGAPVAVARRGNTGTVDDFLALSSTCPHLGCQVHWEPHHNRFFCPCHNGVFDPSGRAVAGPPAEAGQSLLRYPLKIEGGLLYIEVALESVARGTGRSGGSGESLRGDGEPV